MKEARDVKVRFAENCIAMPDGCWLWKGPMHPSGYGSLKVGSRTDASRRQVLAHRLSFELHRGPIPAGMLACHTCDVRACVNPSHLFLGTKRDNARDMVNKGRHASQANPDRRARGERHGSRTMPEKFCGMNPLSMETRNAIVDARKRGEPRAAVAERYSVSVRTVTNVFADVPEVIAEVTPC